MKHTVNKDYLDGKYFYPALSQIDEEGIVQPVPFIVEVRDKPRFTQTYDLSGEDKYLVRLIIKTYNDDILVGQHSNLLIVDAVLKTVRRFEPLSDYTSLPLSKLFSNFTVSVEGHHPQNEHDRWCNVYIIERASAYIQERVQREVDGKTYAEVIKSLFVPLLGPPDVEFGPTRRGARRTGRRTARRTSRRWS